MNPTFSQSHAPRIFAVRYSAALPSGFAYVVDTAGNNLTDAAGNVLVVQIA